MTIFIDADGCPVVDLTIAAARQYQLPCVIVCDTSHVFQRESAQTITVSKGADSADFALVNRLTAGDVVITQDYGLAAMCLSRGALCLSQNGMAYDDGNISALLTLRHAAGKLRRAGGRLKGPAKRTREQNLAFAQALDCLLRQATERNGDNGTKTI